MKLISQGRFWRRFRLVAIAVIGICLGLLVAFVVSFLSGRQSMRVDGMERSYYVHLPPSYDGTRPTPLVLVFHMRTGTAWLMQRVTQMNRLADEHGFIVVYPEGYARSWADGSNRYEADRAGIDDVAFVEALLDALSQELSVDPRRVFASGFSNGAFFSLRLACAMPQRIRAVAAVSGVMAEEVMSNCRPQQPLPTLLMAGDEDQDLPREGKPGLASLQSTIQKWKAVNGCVGPPAVEVWDAVDDGTAVRRQAYVDCQERGELVVYTIEGGGHKWPGGSGPWQFWLSGNRSIELDAGQVLWRFFARQGPS